MNELKKVLVVGSGGREHALAWKLADSPSVKKVFVAPGNGGTDDGKLESVAIKVDDHQSLINFVKENQIDLSVIGPDDALAAGLADDFKVAGLIVFGCTQSAARIESSKAFAKDLMLKNGISTASFQTFTNKTEAMEHVQSGKFPVVIKASGLALGKGVYICHSEAEANLALTEIMTDKKFGDSGNEVVIEEFLCGTELSTHAFCDGETAVMFPASQDYKQARDGGQGPNTGGMGVVAPLPWASEPLMEKAKEEIVEPALKALADTGATFQGLLYPGLMEQDGQLSVVEFNARFGDPETQAYMRLLDSDLYEILTACARGTLAHAEVKWREQFVACVVLASAGYPDSYEKGKNITGIEEAQTNPKVVVFHAGTKRDDEKLVTSGGRVLNVTATADTLEDAIEKAYAACEKINFEGKYFRTDIGHVTLNKKVNPGNLFV